MDKTVYACQVMVFLGMLIDCIRQMVTLPEQKITKAVDSLDMILESKKVKMIQVQKLAGLLNFLCKAIVPGRAFTRRFYSKCSGLKQYHHIRVDAEMKEDCSMWLKFFRELDTVSRPFLDFSHILKADSINFFSDASRGKDLGMGCLFDKNWAYTKWEPGFIDNRDPSIKFLELYGVAVAIELWAGLLKNRRVQIYCDNMGVVNMINASSSSCRLCMILLRIITKTSMQHNVRFFADHIPGKKNVLADHLSRLRISKFRELAPASMSKDPTPLPSTLWPIPTSWWD